MSSDSAARQWTLVLVLTALFLSLVVVAQIVARYGAAYRAAPREMAALLDSADSSLQENESYDRDVAKVPRRDDKIRLGRLLREIQRAGDDLREELNSVLVETGHAASVSNRNDDDRVGFSSKNEKRLTSTTPHPPDHAPPSPLSPAFRSPQLKTSARILWAAKRTRLDERVRRLDLLRMRFLVVYMSIVAASATAAAEKVEKSAVVATTAAASQMQLAANASANSRAAVSRKRSTTGSTTGSSTSSSSSSASSSTAGSLPASAAPSMPSSPRVPQQQPRTAASIVAASIAAAAAAAVAAGNADDKYYPASPESNVPGTPPDFFHHPFHPFRNRLHQSPPSPPNEDADDDEDNDDDGNRTGSLRRKKPPPRRVATSLGIPTLSNSTPEGNHRAGWMGVVQELQRSPLLHKRHTSVEMTMARR